MHKSLRSVIGLTAAAACVALGAGCTPSNSSPVGAESPTPPANKTSAHQDKAPTRELARPDARSDGKPSTSADGHGADGTQGATGKDAAGKGTAKKTTPGKASKPGTHTKRGATKSKSKATAPDKGTKAGTSSKSGKSGKNGKSGSAKPKPHLHPMPPTNPKHKSVPGSELPPPSQQKKKGPPGSIPARPVVHLRLPMPKSGSARGHLVHGFPSAIIPLRKGSTVKTSGLAVQGHRLQVSLSATSSAPPKTVLNYYLRKLSAGGFGEAPSPTLGDATAAQFTRTGDGLVVTVRPHGKHGTAFSITGVLTATR